MQRQVPVIQKIWKIVELPQAQFEGESTDTPGTHDSEVQQTVGLPPTGPAH